MPDPRYGSAHQKVREGWAAVVAAGGAWCCETVCKRVSRWIPPGSDWHLAHTDDGLAYKGPAHPECNCSDGGRRGNPRGRPKPVRPRVRRWAPTQPW